MSINDYTPQQIEEILQAFFEVAGTRQYIGARYVPIFGRGRGTSVDWDGGADAYEPLSIVYYQGDTYTSRRYVPAGIAIDNQDYWVITGRYNAQVEQYRQEVLQFSGRIDGAYEAVDSLRDEVADEYIPFPDGTYHPKYGTANQVLSTLTNGQTEWVDPVIPDSEVVGTYVDAWLDDHPEATTTVQNNSLTTAKYQNGSVTTPKLADAAVTDAKRDMRHPLLNPNTDLNDAPAGVSYLSNNAYVNLPSGIASNPSGVLTTYVYSGWAHKNQILQCTVSGQLFMRFYNGNTSTWYDWVSINQITEVLANNTDLNNVIEGQYILYNHYAYTHLPDSTAHTGILNAYRSSTDGTRMQTYQSVSGGVWFRFYYNGSWREWTNQFGLSLLPANTDLNTTLISSRAMIANSEAASYRNLPPISSDNKTGILEVSKYYNVDGIYIQSVEAIFSGEKFYRYHYADNTWSDWAYDNGKHEISILFVGNSLQQDAVTYLPYILKTYFPNIRFKLYIWYTAAATCATNYAAFTNDTPCNIFSVCENDTRWTNYNDSVTMDDILSTYKFDIVSLMEYFSTRTTFTISDIEDWVNCASYIASNYAGGNGLKFTSWFQTPRIQQGYDPDLIFDLNKQANDLFLQNTVCEDVISPGIAMHRARDTALNSLGDFGGLTPDGVHAQEGLPCLMEAYVVLMWILDKLGIPKSVYGFPLRMTTAIYNTLNVPGPNLGTGVIQGTDAQNLLAQEVAIKAYKEGLYYVLNGLYDVQP